MNDTSPATDPALVLLQFERWANQRLFDACSNLSDEDLDREFEMGLGSLRANLIHVIGAIRGWTDLLNRAEEPRFQPKHDPPGPSIDQLRILHDEVMDDFEAATTSGKPSDLFRPEREGRTYRFSRGGVLAHVTTHSMHHRAQCLNMIRHLGVPEQPESSVFQWMLAHPPEE